MRMKTFFIILALIFSLGAVGQEKQPVINNDNSVTFSFSSPQDKKVKISGSFLSKGNQIRTPIGAFSKESKKRMKFIDGVWKYTTKPLTSELYTYRFHVNNDTIYNDPNNKDIVKDGDDYYNYFIIPGGIADNYIDHETNHGKISYVWYPSKIEGMDKRRMTIYTPYGYDSSKQSYPVLYLLHGSGGDEESWINCGRAIQILDNLISQKKCVPMIVVMPNGNSSLAAAPGKDPNNPEAQQSNNNMSSMLGKIEKVFVDEVVNYVDKNYRTVPERESRAIAGLSLGGLHTLFITLNNPETFDYIGLFSAQTTNSVDNGKISTMRSIDDTWNDIKNVLPFFDDTGLDEKITSFTEGARNGDLSIYENMQQKLDILFEDEPELFYIAVGRDDFTKKLNDDLRKDLNRKNYKFTYNETDGGHTWENWRKYLVDFLPRIF